MGVLILTHRRLLVDQFTRDLTTEGYGGRLRPAVQQGQEPLRGEPDHDPDLRLVRAPRRLDLAKRLPARHLRRGAHGARREDQRRDPQLHRADLHRHDRHRAADRQAGLRRLPRLGRRPSPRRRGAARPDRARCAPCACRLRRPSPPFPSSAATTTRRSSPRSSTRTIFNQAAASLYRDRFDADAGHRLRGRGRPRLQPRAGVPSRGPQGGGRQRPHPAGELAETLAAYERGEINVLVNAQLLAEGWNSPRATICMHLAPTASRRVYQQRIGRIMRLAPRKEAGIVVDFVDDAATHNDRTITHPQPARLRLLPARRARDAGAAPPHPAARQTEALARPLARARDARPAPPRDRDHARVGARQPGPPRRRRAAPLGAHRGPAGPVRGAPGLRREARASQSRMPRGLPHELRRREPEPPPAPLGARRPRRGDRRPRRLRRPRHDGHLRADVGEGPRPGRARPPAGDRRREGRGAGGHRRALDLAARPGDAQAAGPARERRPPGGEAAPRRAHELPRPPARGERREARERRPRAADRTSPLRCSPRQRPTRRPRSA